MMVFAKGLLILVLAYLTVVVNALERKPHPCPPTLRSDGRRVGHLEQLGCQRAPIGPVKEYFEQPTPRELWENHVKPYKPAVLRNALKGSPALSLWDDEYLTNTYGDQDVLIEKKYEDRKSEPKRMEIKEFLANYRKQNWYVVSMLPDAMRQDIRVPKPLMCSTFKKNLAELNLWIGTNGTRSMLHYDADNIMHCVVSGLKDWILIHPDNKPKVDMVLDRQGQNSGFSHLDVDHISEDLVPEVWDVPWQYTTLKSGDCLYLPYQYLHQVRSYDRTISSTFLFYPDDAFSDEDCGDVDYNEYLNLKDVYVYWSHKKGQETVDMGYMNPEMLRLEMVELMKVIGRKSIDLKMFLYFIWAQNGETVAEAGERAVMRLFDAIDRDGDEKISMEEMKNADLEAMKQFCREVESPHGPTQTLLKFNKNLSSKTPEFAPRKNDRHVDSRYASIFISFLLRAAGKNGQMTYPVFKENVEVRDGSIADVFMLFDKNFDGVVTEEEVKNTTQISFRKFSRMGYGLVGTTIRGGGKFAEEVERHDITYLTRLNKIPEDKMMTSGHSQDDDEETAQAVAGLTEFFEGLKPIVQDGGEINAKTFKLATESFKDGEYDTESFDPKIFFAVIDRGGKGYISSADLDFYIANESFQIDERLKRSLDRLRPMEVLTRIIMNMEQVLEFEDGLYHLQKIQKKKNNAAKEKQKPDRSEL